MKKTNPILALVVAVIFVMPSLACAGSNTANGWFYKPSYGAKGVTEYNLFNAAVDASDTKWQAMYVAYLAYGSAATIDPGHKHSKLWASDGSPESITIDSLGYVGIRTTSPSLYLDVRDELGLSNGSLAHGMTGIAATTVGMYASTSASGGVTIDGLTSTDVVPILLQGFSGQASPTNAMVQIVAGKKSGTAAGAISAAEIAFRVDNWSTNLLTLQGNGDLTIAGNIGVAEVDYGGTSTIVGWSATPTKNIYIKKIGRTVFVKFIIEGTSNSTSTSFTVPYIIRGASVGDFIYMASDNSGSYVASHGVLSADGYVVVLRPTLNSATWTASNTKTVSGQFFYETD